jgi:staphylococcal nuclease domain-containing protein 1
MTLMLAGVQCPSLGRATDATPEPYAREAKHFAECMLLHREMLVSVEGEDKFGHVFGSLAAMEGQPPLDVAAQLCRLGLAKTAGEMRRDAITQTPASPRGRG